MDFKHSCGERMRSSARPTQSLCQCGEFRHRSELPLDRIGCVHIAGGRWIKAPNGTKHYLLDDHLHEVTGPVYELLAEVAARTAHPLTVVLERDGAFPPMAVLLDELDRTRAALAAGRLRRLEA